MSVTNPRPASSNGHERKPDGVRTYRGRRVEEIIPQIREELGPDAVILRQREGLMGGVSGFFAQRCVEVDARPGTPTVDVYAGDDDGDEAYLPPRTEETAWPTTADRGDDEPAPVRPAPARRSTSVQRPVPASTFASELADAETSPAEKLPAAEEGDDTIAAAAMTDAPVAAVNDASVAFEIDGHAAAVRLEEILTAAGLDDAAVRAGTEILTAAGEDLATAPAGTEIPDAAGTPDSVAPAPAGVAPAAAPRRRRAAAKATATAASAPRRGRRGKRGDAGRQDPPAPDVITETASAKPAAPATPEPAPAIAKPRRKAAARKLDDALVTAGVRELTDQGISETWARQLIAVGAAHSKPFAGGDLREAALSSIAAGLPTSRPLPVAGAAVAIIGAGGAGKTRAAAALASAYARGSTLAVTVVSLASRDAGREITELLHEEGDIHIAAAADAGEASTAVKQGREGGLVVIDTAAPRPGEAAAIDALARELDALDLDAVYIAVPATLSPRAARNLIDSFAVVAPTAIVITHADEIDHIGVPVEIAHDHWIPVAYVHEGLELDGALSLSNPVTLAKRLLP